MTKDEVRLLVRADDAGSSWASNAGCLKACELGLARSVEVMMPCAWVEHAAHLFNERPDIDIGIHLTLTSEWDAVKWRPLTEASSLVDEKGYFHSLLIPRPGDPRSSLMNSGWDLGDIEREFRAQIHQGVRTFKNATHVSAHMVRHFLDFDKAVGHVVAELCREFDLMDDPFGHGLPRFEGYPKFPRDTRQRVKAFVDRLTSLESGTYIFIDHPAVNAPELRHTGHAGYEDVLEDRTTCLETLVSDDLHRAVSEMGIQIIGYRDL
ncbi:MAG: ChbG/HpnK family deacetylase [Inquilinaceae bacterium]